MKTLNRFQDINEKFEHEKKVNSQVVLKVRNW